MDENPPETQTFSLRSVWRDLKLHPTVWKPTEDPKALLFVCHGIGEHMGRYDELGSHLTHCGVLVFGHDHVGNGQTEGDPVYVEDCNTYVQDVIAHIELMRNRYPQLPCILMGHSMGGLVAAHVAIQRCDLFTALILSAAPAELEAALTYTVVRKMFQLLASVAPQLGVRNIDTNDISSIPEEVERYVNDPLIWHGPWKAGWVMAMVRCIILLRQNVARISLPLLLIHGSEDNLVRISGSHFINDNATSHEKRFEVFEGSRHETLHDREQERARELVKEWVLSHLTTAQVPDEPQPQNSPSHSDPSAETQMVAKQQDTEVQEEILEQPIAGTADS